MGVHHPDSGLRAPRTHARAQQHGHEDCRLGCRLSYSGGIRLFVLTYQLAVITIHRYYLAVKKYRGHRMVVGNFFAHCEDQMRYSFIAFLLTWECGGRAITLGVDVLIYQPLCFGA